MENDDSEPTKKKFRNHLVWIIVLVLGVIGIIVVLICWAVGLFTIPKVKPGNSGLHASYVDVCRQKKTGRFPYPGDCQRFVECGERIASVLQCPKGYYYKQDIKQCTEDTNSTCKGQASAQHAQIESVKGGCSEWGNWTTCSKTCGTGTQTRDRLCDNPTPQPLNNDTKCMGNEQQIRKCNENKCPAVKPVKGGWSEWGNWTTCSKTCGAGTQTRDRLCNNPTPQPLNNDTKCKGNEQQTRECNENMCPVKGGWSEWGNWTICSKTCGTGTQTRDRLCNNPTPQPLNNDTKCKGNEQQTRKCNENKCPAVKPVKGGWSQWGTWTICSNTCGTGTQTRDRLCNNPAPQPLTKKTKCKGTIRQTRKCYKIKCPVVKPEKNRFRRLGCYKSTANSRALDIDMEEFPKSMPAHKRIVNCASLAEVYQAVYFGVQSKTCYIDLEDGEHNFLKNGKSNKCKKGVGGLNAMTVYEVNPKN